MILLAILAFFVLQVGAGLLFKCGSMHQEYWTPTFVLGNIMGITSIYFLMLVYKHLNANVGDAICRGGYFVLIQIAFLLVFRTEMNLIQWSGIAAIFTGVLMVSLCGN